MLLASLTATASAAEVSGHVKEIYNESSGTYTTLENAIPVKNATVQVLRNGTLLNQTLTLDDGSYHLTFTSESPVELRISYHSCLI